MIATEGGEGTSYLHMHPIDPPNVAGGFGATLVDFRDGLTKQKTWFEMLDSPSLLVHCLKKSLMYTIIIHTHIYI